MKPKTLTTIALTIVLLAGCGSESEPEAERPPETADRVPELPPDWKVHRNEDAGFAFGVPPGWSARNEGIETELLSPDELVAGRIAANRSDEVLEQALDEIAEAEIVNARIKQLEAGDTRKLGHRYDAVAIEADGVAGKEEIRQAFLFAVIRREDQALVEALFARNAEQPTGGYVPDIERIIRSIRTQPVR